jgi:hypothetical protein
MHLDKSVRGINCDCDSCNNYDAKSKAFKLATVRRKFDVVAAGVDRCNASCFRLPHHVPACHWQCGAVCIDGIFFRHSFHRRWIITETRLAGGWSPHRKWWRHSIGIGDAFAGVVSLELVQQSIPCGRQYELGHVDLSITVLRWTNWNALAYEN